LETDSSDIPTNVNSAKESTAQANSPLQQPNWSDAQTKRAPLLSPKSKITWQMSVD